MNLSLDGGAAVLAHRTRSTTVNCRRIPEALRIGSITARVGDDNKGEGDVQVPSHGAWRADQTDGAIVPVLIGNHSQQSRNRFHVAILRRRLDLSTTFYHSCNKTRDTFTITNLNALTP